MKKYLMIITGFVLCCFHTNALNEPGGESFSDRMDHVFGLIDSTRIPSGFLYNKTPMGSCIPFCKGQESDTIVQMMEWMFMYYEIKESSIKDTFPDELSLMKSAKTYFNETGVVPIGIMEFEYQQVNEKAVEKGHFINHKGQIKEEWVSQDNFDTKTLFSACAMVQQSNNTTVDFRWLPEYTFGNEVDEYSNHQIDFGDGYGFLPLETNLDYSISYRNDGIKEITIKATGINGDYTSRFYFIVGNNAVNTTRNMSSTCWNTNAPTSMSMSGEMPAVIADVEADQAYYSNMTNPTGKIGIYYAPSNVEQKLRKPFLISVGFNPEESIELEPSYYSFSNSINIQGIGTVYYPDFEWNVAMRGPAYSHMDGRVSPQSNRPGTTPYTPNGTQYLDKLREEGFDVVILWFDNGTDYVQNTAYVIKKVIESVQDSLEINGSRHEIVFQGNSMGALASRYALNLMEYEYQQGTGRHHRVKQWVSFEGEHQGANVPMGFQHFLKLILNTGSSTIVDFVSKLWFNTSLDIINSDAARQLVYYHNLGSTGGQMRPFWTFDKLREEMDNLSPGGALQGYPRFPRRISVSQGSGRGINVPGIIPGDTMAHVMRNPTAGLIGAYWARKRVIGRWQDASISQQPIATVFEEVHVLSLITNIRRDTVKMSSNLQLDNAPGSLGSLHHAAFGYNPLTTMNCPGYNLINEVSWEESPHSFAPTTSCIDLKVNGQPAPLTTNLDAMNLDYFRMSPNGSVGYESPRHSFGYPNLAFPADHYDHTPFDGVFFVGQPNIGWQNNQEHLSDPENHIADYVVNEELAPYHLKLQNREIGITGGYVADFESRDSISLGRKVSFQTDQGDFVVNQDGDVRVLVDGPVFLEAGFRVDHGGKFETSRNTAYQVDNLRSGWTSETMDLPEEGPKLPVQIEETSPEEKGFMVFPNPATEFVQFSFADNEIAHDISISDIKGSLVLKKTLQPGEKMLHVNHLEPGIYFITLHGHEKTKTLKLLIHESY